MSSNFYRPTLIIGIQLIIYKLLRQKAPGEFYQVFKVKVIPIL